MTDVLHSKQDASVNFIVDHETGFFESRYVHRPESDYFIAYLSSHNGCNKACRFCHLTATGQTMMSPATPAQLVAQFDRVFDHYRAQPPKLNKCHINFMARGEPLANPYITDPASWESFSTEIVDKLWEYDQELSPTFRISTIMPKETENLDLEETFLFGDEIIYYSLYSFNPKFRKRWLPKAMDPDRALEKIRRWQYETGQEAKIHFALISGENDSKEDIEQLIERIKRADLLNCSLNLVRFNTPNADKYVESERVEEIAQQLNAEFPARIIPRVGKDVYASCGMFYNEEN